MRCSIIIPAFNAERFLRQTVSSICEQDVVDWELIIVDDGSNDSTPHICDELANADSRVRVIHQPNKGLSGARNAGFKASSLHTDFLLFIDADDVLLPAALTTLLSVARHVPHAPAVYGDCSYISGDGRDIGDPFPPRRIIRDSHALQPAPAIPGVGFSPSRTFAAGNCISSTGQVLIRRWALGKTGVFDEALSPVADWDLWLRLSDGVGPLAFTSSQVMAYRVHGYSMSRHLPRMRSAEARMRLKHLKTSTRMRDLMTRGIREVDREHRSQLVGEISRCLIAKDYGKLPRTLARLAYMASRGLIPVTWPLVLNAHLRGR